LAERPPASDRSSSAAPARGDAAAATATASASAVAPSDATKARLLAAAEALLAERGFAGMSIRAR